MYVACRHLVAGSLLVFMRLPMLVTWNITVIVSVFLKECTFSKIGCTHVLPCFKDSVHSGMVVEDAPLHAERLTFYMLSTSAVTIDITCFVE
jgi:hypothetical protein